MDGEDGKGRGQRYGPLALDRRRKGDGRALILYWAGRAAPAQPAAEEPAGQGPAGATSELRFNELRGEEVVYAIHRQDRTFLPAEDHCPLDATRPGGPATEIPLPSFEIAVFDNLFPAFEAPQGSAEVVVYTDDHHGSFPGLSRERAHALMWVWRQRYEELASREDVEYVLIFENRGVEVGVTLHHPHGQIYAYPFLPPVAALEVAADGRLGGCAMCSLLSQELSDGERVVYENEGLVAYVPRAARWAFETHVVMREHRRSLIECTAPELEQLATGLQAVTRGFDTLFGRPFPYVMVVHQAPTRASANAVGAGAGRAGGGATATGGAGGGATGTGGAATAGADGGGHLHVEFYPPLRTAEKLKYLAGSEQGAGTFISDTLPEESAATLRDAITRAT